MSQSDNPYEPVSGVVNVRRVINDCNVTPWETIDDCTTFKQLSEWLADKKLDPQKLELAAVWSTLGFGCMLAYKMNGSEYQFVVPAKLSKFEIVILKSNERKIKNGS